MSISYLLYRLSPFAREIITQLERPCRLSVLRKRLGARRVKETLLDDLQHLHGVVSSSDAQVDPEYHLTDIGRRVAAILSGERVMARRG